MSNDERPDSLAAQAAAWVPPWERPRTEPDRAYQAAHRATDGSDGQDGAFVADDVADEQGFASVDGRAGDAHDGDSADQGAGDGSAGDGGADHGAGVGGAGGGGVSAVEVEASVRAEQVAAVEGGAELLEADAEQEFAAERVSASAGLDDGDGGGGRPDDDEDRSGAGLSDDDDDFDTTFEQGNPPGYGESDPESPVGDEAGAVVDEPRELSGEDDAEPTDVRLGGEVPLPASIEQAVEAGEDEGGAPVDAPLPPDGDDAGDVFDAAADDDVTDDDDVDLPFEEVVPASDDDEERALAADEAEFRTRSGLGDDGREPDSVELGDRDESGLGGDASAGESGPAGLSGQGSAGGRAGLSGEASVDAATLAVDDEAAAYMAGAADVGAALGGLGADELAAPGGLGAGDPAALGELGSESPGLPGGLGAGDRAELGAAGGGPRPAAGDGLGVPAQGRRRRGGVAASGGEVARTAEASDPEEGGAAEGLGDAVPALEDEAELGAALEAIMLVVDEPVGEMQLAQILEQPTERVAAALEDLSARYTAAGHGFDLRRAAGGWRFYTRPEYAAYVERFVLDGQSVRLTQAALETLAVVAYKQPVTRSRISAIRGVNCDGVMRTLATRGLIEECGTEGETGAHLYRTTALFLEKLGLNSVEQLPPLAPFLPDDVEEVLDATG
jgi:segregation and condensation protein B